MTTVRDEAARFDYSGEVRQNALARVLPPWWLLLLSGLAWVVAALIILRFDYTSVYAISLLFGFVAIAAGVAEIGVAFIATGGWKFLNAILAIVFIVAGVVALVSPGGTFVSLAAIFSFVLILAGAFDIIGALAASGTVRGWWLQLIGGIAELLLGFWAAGYYGRSTVLLIAWAAAFALIRGIRDITLAFRTRDVQHAIA